MPGSELILDLIAGEGFGGGFVMNDVSIGHQRKFNKPSKLETVSKRWYHKMKGKEFTRDVIGLVAESGFVMNDWNLPQIPCLSEPSKMETLSKRMYLEMNGRNFILNKRWKRLMEDRDMYKRHCVSYCSAIEAVRNIVIVDPVTRRTEFAKISFP